MAKPKTDTTYKIGNLYQIPITDLNPDPNQPRQYFDEESINDMAKSIEKHGVIQPILFREDNGKLIIVSGERRYRAAIKADKKDILAILTEDDPIEIALVENLSREDLNDIEAAEGIERLIEQHGYTHEQVADILGKARSTVTEIISLLKLPSDIREECKVNPRYARRELKKIAFKKKPETMRSEFQKYKEFLDEKKKKGGGRSGNRPKVDVATSYMTELPKKIDAVLKNAKKKEKDILRNELAKLRDKIDEVLVGLE